MEPNRFSNEQNTDIKEDQTDASPLVSDSLIKTPSWLIEAVPPLLSEDAAKRYAIRQRISRVTFDLHRTLLQSVPSDRRPQEPTSAEAHLLRRRGWEKRFCQYRKDLRNL
jgi:hypothetical protein